MVHLDLRNRRSRIWFPGKVEGGNVMYRGPSLFLAIVSDFQQNYWEWINYHNFASEIIGSEFTSTVINYPYFSSNSVVKKELPNYLYSTALESSIFLYFFILKILVKLTTKPIFQLNSIPTRYSLSFKISLSQSPELEFGCCIIVWRFLLILSCK